MQDRDRDLLTKQVFFRAFTGKRNIECVNKSLSLLCCIYCIDGTKFSKFPISTPSFPLRVHIASSCGIFILLFFGGFSILFPQPTHSSRLLRSRSEAEVRLDGAEVREETSGLLALDGGVNDNIITGDPVDGGGDLVLVTELEGVDNTEDLGAVAAGGGRVGEDGADDLLRVNDEDRTDGESNTLLVNVGGVLVVDPVEVTLRLVLFSTEERAAVRKLTCHRGKQPCAPCRQ